MDSLSVMQQKILDFVTLQVNSKGYPPSVREICKAVGLKSTSSVHAHLKTLEKKGYITKDPTIPRSLRVVEEDNVSSVEYVNVPVIGKITAGEPILAVENIETTFPIPIDYINNSTVFMLKVSGESMIDAGILNNDFVLVKQQNTANNGDIVVALIEDEATIKTFYKEKDYVRLQPENSSMKPIIVKDNLTILGKLAGVFRFL